MFKLEEINNIIQRITKLNEEESTEVSRIMSDMAKVMKLQETDAYDLKKESNTEADNLRNKIDVDVTKLKNEINKIHKKLNIVILVLVLLVTSGGISIAEILMKFNLFDFFK